MGSVPVTASKARRGGRKENLSQGAPSAQRERQLMVVELMVDRVGDGAGDGCKEESLIL